MSEIVRSFAQKYCSIDSSVTELLEQNYKNCYALAEEWAQKVKDWLDPDTDSTVITDVSAALDATQRVVDLIKAGNDTREEYVRSTIERTTPRPLFSKLASDLRENYFTWNKILSIQHVRQETNCGLKEAKDFVEAFVATDEIMQRNATIHEVIT